MTIKSNKKEIHYSQCWEDANLVLEALAIKKSDNVVSITSGGCNTFALASKHPKSIVAVDYNPAQTALAELKYLAIQNFARDNYLEFVGVLPSVDRMVYINYLFGSASPELQDCIEKSEKLIRAGLIHSGKFEKYLQLFRWIILPLAQTDRTVSEMFNTPDKEKQKNLYDKKWNNWRWRLFAKLFLSKSVMEGVGRHKNMFTYNTQTTVGDIYLQRTEEHLQKGATFQNPYLEYIFTGGFKLNFPVYLQTDVYKKISQYKDIQFKTESLTEYLQSQTDNSIDKFNLSDIFEPMSEDETEQAFEQILRTAKNGARLLFWNNLVHRDVPESMHAQFIYEERMVNQLAPKEQVFFYDKFYLYTVIKQ